MSAGAAPEPPRQLPATDADTAFYWRAGERGRLEILRCAACRRYVHPPLPRCPRCGNDGVAPEAVSGRGRVASYTVNHQPWRPGLAVPYVFAAVELVEQAELYVLTNIVGCAPDTVTIGMPVTVRFDHRGDVWLPLFEPARG